MNENTVVRALVPKAEVQTFESSYIVDRAFSGSLPSFIAAFTQNAKLTTEEAEVIRKMIDQAEEK